VETSYLIPDVQKVSLVALPTELLVYIISFLSSISDQIKLRYVSSWLRCVIEGTPSLWKEFVGLFVTVMRAVVEGGVEGEWTIYQNIILSQQNSTYHQHW